MKIDDDNIKKKTEKKNNQDNSSTKKQNRVLNTYIWKNTPIIVYLPEKISSLDNAREGESLVLYVDKDYREDGIVIIPGGTKVYCSINEIKKGDGRKRGTIEIEAQYIQTSDGTRIPLKESVFRYVGQRGENVTFKKGQKFKVKTAKRTNLTVNY